MSHSSFNLWADVSGQLHQASSLDLHFAPLIDGCELERYPFSAFSELPSSSPPPSITYQEHGLHANTSLGSSTDTNRSVLQSAPPLISSIEPSPTSHKRRVRGLTEGERSVRRRTLHRDIDATRRIRESVAINRLDNLLKEHQQAFIEEDGGSRGVKSAGAGRVQVLERSAEVIQQLWTMCQTMERACNAKDQQLRNLADQLQSAATTHARDTIASCMDCPPFFPSSQCGHSSPPAPSASFSLSSSSPLSVLPAPLSATLLHLQHTCSLRDEFSLGSPLCVLVKLMPSSVLISASIRFCQQSGYHEQQLVGTTIGQTLQTGGCPLLIQKGDEKTGRPERVVQQYGRNGQNLLALLSGDVERVEQVWRCVIANGQQYEVPVCWSELWQT